MIRKIIKINEELCNGCGKCVTACHEGAIKLINNKAKLLRDDYCDGLGDCLPACPVNAISFEVREALEYNEEAVIKNKNCISIQPKILNKAISINKSSLSAWPVQIKLVPQNASFFNNSNLLIAADCTAYAYSNFHNDFVKNNVVLIGCPKLDNTDYSEKLTSIISNNNINNITVVKMEVPCCKGIEIMVKKAILNSNKNIDLNIVTISTNGNIIKL